MTESEFGFRIRARVCDGHNLWSSTDTFTVADEAIDGEAVTATLYPEKRSIAFLGGPYPSPSVADEAGTHWYERLRLALAHLRVGVDFGERIPFPRVDDSDNLDRPLDRLGLVLFRWSEDPQFESRGYITPMDGPSDRQLKAVVRQCVYGDTGLAARGRLAYDLYAASLMERSVDARFVTLMMAVEALVRPGPRSAETLAHIDLLMRATEQSSLNDEDRAALRGPLERLRRESITQAGKRRAESLGDRTYFGESAPRFFGKCYELRSRMVHGGQPRPEPHEVDARRRTLEGFVLDLIVASAEPEPAVGPDPSEVQPRDTHC